MKRTGFLMERLCTKENALQAIAEINEDRKNNKTAQWVERTKEERAAELCEIVRDFHPKPPRTFPRYDPAAGKTRIINEPALWPDQYVHHMIVQTLRPVLMRGMDHFCCGSIPGRGPHKEKKAIEKWLDKDRKGTKYAAEADIKKFYDSLSPRVVMRFLSRKIKDRAFLDLVWRIIKGGIKIGIRRYGRYIDNFTFFSPNKKKLHKAIRAIMEFLAPMGLRLKGNWQVYNTRKRMVDAVGYRMKRGLTLIRKRNLLRLKRQCTRARKRIEARRRVDPKQARGILSRAGQLKHCAGKKQYEKHVLPIRPVLKNAVREDAKRRSFQCLNTRSA